MGNYSFDQYLRTPLETSTLIQVYREDATNFLIRLRIAGETDGNRRAEWRLKVVNTAWHLAGLSIVDLSSINSDIDISTSTSKVEYAFRLGASGDIEALFEFVGGIHGNQNGTSVTFVIDGIDITSLATGASAYGYSLVVSQTIDDIYPVDDLTVAAETTLVHTITFDHIRMDVSHAFNSNDSWEIFTHYAAMLPVDETGCDTFQIEGFSAALANNDDDNWYQDGTEATWCEFSDTGHDYKVRVTMPTGGPNLAGDWSNSGSIKCGMLDRSDAVNKFYAFNITGTFADRVSVSNTTIASRSDYTVTK